MVNACPAFGVGSIVNTVAIDEKILKQNGLIHHSQLTIHKIPNDSYESGISFIHNDFIFLTKPYAQPSTITK